MVFNMLCKHPSQDPTQPIVLSTPDFSKPNALEITSACCVLPENLVLGERLLWLRLTHKSRSRVPTGQVWFAMPYQQMLVYKSIWREATTDVPSESMALGPVIFRSWRHRPAIFWLGGMLTAW